MDETSLIRDYLRPLATHPGALSLKDDAALLSPAQGKDWVLTQDSLSAGVHFFPDDPLDSVAKKLLRVNLSDLAAKGATPVGYLLSCFWPHATHKKDILKFIQGLKADIHIFGGALLGGDTVYHDGPLAFTLTAIGEVPGGTMLTRSGARAGDAIYVSGTIGDAYLGLSLRRHPETYRFLKKAARDRLLQCYHLPQPQLLLGAALRGVASASMDISDGLALDLSRLIEASGAGAMLYLEKVPFSAEALTCLEHKSVSAHDLISGGDDYRLLFTAPNDKNEELLAISCNTNVSLARIGEITTGGGLHILDKNGKEVRLKKQGFVHGGK